MGLLEYIERTRKKPESSRRRTAVVITLLIMAVVVALWLTISVGLRPKTKTDLAPSPFSVLKNTLRDTLIK